MRRAQAAASGERGELPEGVTAEAALARAAVLAAGRRLSEERVRVAQADCEASRRQLAVVMAIEEAQWRDSLSEEEVDAHLAARDAELMAHPALIREARTSSGADADGFSVSRGLGATLGNHTGVYASGRALGLVVAFVQALVTIQFLGPSAFGRVAVIITLASFVSLSLRLIVRRGSLSRTFGRNAGDDDDDEPDEEVETETSGRDPRRSLGTGLVLMAGAGIIVSALFTVVGRFVANGPYADLLGLVGVLGALGILFDTLEFVPMMERRPGAFLLATLSRPLLAVTFGLAALIAGLGPVGLLLGNAAGTAIALVGVGVAFRHAFVLGVDRSEIAPILASSRQRWLRTLAHWGLRNEHLLLLAAVGTAPAVGGFRLANQVVQPLAFPFGAFFQAWLPLERSPLMLATNNHYGRERLRGQMLTYCVVGVVLAILGLASVLRVLDAIVPGRYAAGVGLVPWLVGVVVAEVLLQAIHRFGRFSGRRRTYDRSLAVAAVVGAALSVVGVVLLGARGAALGATLATGGTAAFLLAKTQTGDAPLELEWGKLAAALLLGLPCGLTTLLLDSGVRTVDVFVDIAAPVAYVGLCCAVGIVPKTHRRLLGQLVRGVGGRRRDVLASATIAALGESERSTLRAALVRRDESAQPLAGAAPTASSIDLAALAILRKCARQPERGGELERQVAAWALAPLTPLDRHHLAFRLYRAKVPPEELALLDRWRLEAERALV